MAHFEIHVNDLSAAKAFYSDLFGWTFEQMPMDGMDYQIANGAGLGGDLTVGMFVRMDTAQTAGTAIRGGTMTFEVADVDAKYAWALDNGGAEALPPTDFPGIGRCAYVEDGQGNVVGMITPAEAN